MRTAVLFSYAPEDAESAPVAEIVALLEAALAEAYGAPVAVGFETPGDRLSDGPAGIDAPLFAALVSPAYLANAGCRTELARALLTEAKTGGRDRILPVRWAETSNAGDPAAMALAARGGPDWSDLRGLEALEPAIEALAADLAGRLTGLWGRGEGAETQAVAPPPSGPETPPAPPAAPEPAPERKPPADPPDRGRYLALMIGAAALIAAIALWTAVG